MLQKLFRLKQRLANNKNVLMNIGWLSLDKFIRMLFALIVNIWVARYLGPEQFGILSYVTAYVALYLVVSNLSFDSILIRELVNNKESTNRYMSTAFIMRLASGCFIFLLCAFISYVSETDSVVFTLILITSSNLLIQALDVSDVYFQSIIRAKIIVVLKVSVFILASIARIYLVIEEYSLPYFVWLAQIELLIAGIFVTIAFIRANKDFRLTFDSKFARLILRDGWPLIFSGILITLHTRVDQVMLRHMATDVELGNYSVGVKVAELWYLIPTFIVNSYMPVLVSVKSDMQVFKTKLQVLYDGMTWAAIGIAFLTCIFSDFIIDLLYGEEFEGAAIILATYIWTVISVFLGTTSGMYFLAINKTKLSLLRLLTGVLLNIPLNLLLIPIYQGVGAVVATIISYFTSLYVVDFFFARENFIMMIKSFDVVRIARTYLKV